VADAGDPRCTSGLIIRTETAINYILLLWAGFISV
jgi:hypothetical protein